MKKVSKCLIFDKDGNLLLLFRSSAHPKWPLEADFPGGTLEKDENILEATSRELKEETGIDIPADQIKIVFEELIAKEDSINKKVITEARVEKFPKINLSWEHSSYKIITLDELIEDESNHSSDDYFQTVLKYLKNRK